MNTEEDLEALDITGLESYEEKVLVSRALKKRSLAGEYDKEERAEIEETLKEPTGKMLRALTGYAYCIKSREDKDIIANEAYIYWAENFWKKFRSDNIRHYLGFLRCCMLKGYSKAANYTEHQCKKYKDAQRIKQRIFDITFRHATYEEFKKDFGAFIHTGIYILHLSMSTICITFWTTRGIAVLIRIVGKAMCFPVMKRQRRTHMNDAGSCFV